MTNPFKIASALLLILMAHSVQPAAAAECCDPKSPFREGEGWADTPATCGNAGYWAQRAPDTSARITMIVRGRLTDVRDGVIAYLVMCEAPAVQIVCVTYQTNGMQRGEDVTFAGGYERRGTRIILDPCLASRE